MRFQAIPRLISRINLHASIPVDITPLIDRYEVQYHALKTVMGFAFRYDHAGLIGVNSNLHRYEQRMVLAHEVAHLTLHTRADYYSCRQGDWWHNRLEMQAQYAASVLLVPTGSFIEDMCDGATVDELADRYEVPSDLVLIRFRLGEYANTPWITRYAS